MSRDLENFAKYFLSAYQVGMAGSEHHLDRQARIDAAKLKYAHDMAREARENRKTDQWINQSQEYMKYLQRKGGAGGKGGGAKAPPGDAQGFLNDMQKAYPNLTPGPVQQPPVNNYYAGSSESDAPAPPNPPGGGGGGFGGSDDDYAQGGAVRVRPPDYAGGTTGPGSGYGTIAAPPSMRRGGRVPKFAGGGGIPDMGIDNTPEIKKPQTATQGIGAGFTSGIASGIKAMDKAATAKKAAPTQAINPTVGAVGSYGVGGGGMDASDTGYRRGGRVQRFQDGGKPEGGDDTGWVYDPGSEQYVRRTRPEPPPRGYRPEGGEDTGYGRDPPPYDFPREPLAGKPDYGPAPDVVIKNQKTDVDPSDPIPRKPLRLPWGQEAPKRKAGPRPTFQGSLPPPEDDVPVRSEELTGRPPSPAISTGPPGSDARPDIKTAPGGAGSYRPPEGGDDTGLAGTPSADGEPNSPDQYYRDDPRKNVPLPPVTIGGPGAPGGGRGGGGPGGGGRSGGGPGGGRGGGAFAAPGPRKALGDQTRIEAYDPTADYGDPRNIHAVDRWGRSRAAGQAPAAPAAGGGQRTAPSGEVDVRGPAQQGMSSNSASADYEASQGASNFAEHQFHLGNTDANSARGYETLAAGHGAPTIATIDQMRRAVDPEGKLPPNELMRNLRNQVYKFYMDKGDKAKADKSAFEVSQFGNVMAKGHGANAQKMLAKGDIQGATNEIAAGYNWLPNGHTVNISPDGKSAVIEGPDGKIIHQIPLDPAMLKQVSDGMAHGVFNWDVMNGGGALPAPALNGPGGAPPTGGGAPTQAVQPTVPGAPTAQPPPAGAPAPGGGLPSTVSGGPPAAPPGQQPWNERPSGAPGTPIVPAAQPSAAPAGPAQPPAAGPPAQPPAQPPAKPPAQPPAGAPPTAGAPPSAIQPVAPSSLAPVTQGGGTPPPARPAAAAPPAPSTSAAPSSPPAQTTGTGTKPQPPAKPAATSPPSETKKTSAEEDKYKPWKDNPDYAPDRLVRRDSKEPKGMGSEEYRARTDAIEQQYRKDEQNVMQLALKNGMIKTDYRVQAHLQGLKQEATEKMAKLKEEHAEYLANVKEENRKEEQQGASRKIGGDTPESGMRDHFEKLLDADYLKYVKYKPEDEAKKLAADPNYKVPAEFSTIHQSPLSYMANKDDRGKLTDIAQAIWQTNPKMTERAALDHALTFTSTVGANDSGANFHTGQNAKHYAGVGHNIWDHAVVTNKLGEKVHIDKDTLHQIDLLRAKNWEMKQEDLKTRQGKADKTVTGADLKKKAEHLFTGKGKDPNKKD